VRALTRAPAKELKPAGLDAVRGQGGPRIEAQVVSAIGAWIRAH
jgi:hypothetical protein